MQDHYVHEYLLLYLINAFNSRKNKKPCVALCLFPLRLRRSFTVGAVAFVVNERTKSEFIPQNSPFIHYFLAFVGNISRFLDGTSKNISIFVKHEVQFKVLRFLAFFRSCHVSLILYVAWYFPK